MSTTNRRRGYHSGFNNNLDNNKKIIHCTAPDIVKIKRGPDFKIHANERKKKRRFVFCYFLFLCLCVSVTGSELYNTVATVIYCCLFSSYFWALTVRDLLVKKGRKREYLSLTSKGKASAQLDTKQSLKDKYIVVDERLLLSRLSPLQGGNFPFLSFTFSF